MAFKELNIDIYSSSSIMQSTAYLEGLKASLRQKVASVSMSKMADATLEHPVRAAVLFISILFIISYVINTWKAVKSPLSSIPGPWYAPFTTLHLMWGFATGEIWKQAEDAHTNYGSIVRLGPRQIWISDKAAMKEILLTKDLPKVTMYAEISRDRFSPGLFGEIRPQPHFRLKKFLSPAFTVAYVDKLDMFFSKSIEHLVSKYEDLLGAEGSPLEKKAVRTDMMDDLHNVALDIMGECSFGRGFGRTNPNLEKMESDDDQVWASIPKSIFLGMTKRYQQVYVKRFFRSLGIDWKYDWPGPMIKAIDYIVRGRQRLTVPARPDLMQHLVDEGMRPDSGYKMTTRDIVDQMSEVLLAGSETTSGTIACLWLELCREPRVKKTLLESLPPLRPDAPIIDSKEIRNNPTYEYLNACIKEVLRLHPIASEMGRRTGNTGITLMGHYLPPHTVVSASYRDLHRNPEFWPQPLRFWPERWLTGEKRGDAPEADLGAYYPFSAGKHSCIGINFAWAEMRMLAGNMFSRYDFEEEPGQDIDFRQYITMQFATGSWNVWLRRRTSIHRD